MDNLFLITKSKILKEKRILFEPYEHYTKYQQNIKQLLSFCLRNRKCETLRDIIRMFNVGELYRDTETLLNDIHEIKEEEQ
jgi:hypothetical protein